MQPGYLLLPAGWLVFMRQHPGGRREEEATLHFVCLALRAGCILTKLYVPSILLRPPNFNTFRSRLIFSSSRRSRRHEKVLESTFSQRRAAWIKEMLLAQNVVVPGLSATWLICVAFVKIFAFSNLVVTAGRNLKVFCDNMQFSPFSRCGRSLVKETL